MALVVYYLAGAMNGAIDGLGRDFGFLLSLVGAVNLGLWAVIDAKRRRRPIPLSLQPWFVLLGMLLVPGYVIASRRWRGLGWVLLHGVGQLVVAFVSYGVVATVSGGF